MRTVLRPGRAVPRAAHEGFRCSSVSRVVTPPVVPVRAYSSAQQQAAAPLVVERHGHRRTEYFTSHDDATLQKLRVVEKSSQERRPFQVARVLKSLFLPAGYPSSVRSDYIHFQKWEVAKGIVSSAGFVISTHALLNAVGMGTGAMPAAAAISWVLKDGLGCLGMMLVAGAFGKFFDTETKRIRWTADCIHVAGVGLELATPLFPAFFLPLASIANAAKGIAGLTTGATKAAINQGLALKDNLGDITAKGHSQGIVAYLMGMGIGIGTTYITGGHLQALFGVYGVLAACHLAFSHRALVNVKLTSLSRQRLDTILASFHEHGTVTDPSLIEERILLPSPNHFRGCKIVMGASIRDALVPSSSFRLLDRIGSFLSIPSSPSSPPPPSASGLLRSLVDIHRQERFLLRYARERNSVLVVLHEDATSDDLLRAYFGAYHLRKLAIEEEARGGRHDVSDADAHLERESLAYTKEHYATFEEKLDARGWTRNVVLATGTHRARW